MKSIFFGECSFRASIYKHITLSASKFIIYLNKDLIHTNWKEKKYITNKCLINQP